jgi:hypothetical protein
MKRAKAVPVILWLALAMSCAPKVHTGAINAFDSKTYDSLLVYQSVLDSAKIEFAQGKLPASAKPIINKAGETYNLLRDAWLAYRASQTQDTTAKVQQLTVQMDAIISDLNALLKKKESL